MSNELHQGDFGIIHDDLVPLINLHSQAHYRPLKVIIRKSFNYPGPRQRRGLAFPLLFITITFKFSADLVRLMDPG